MKKNLLILFIGFFIVIFWGIIFLSDTWELISIKSNDILFKIRGKIETSGDIVIVGIDDETFSTLNTQWPFPRSYYAQLIENLERAKVKLIVFDIEFFEESIIEQDSILKETLAKYDNIIFSNKIIKIKNESYVSFQLLKTVKSLNFPREREGAVNIFQDKDQFVRNYFLQHSNNDNVVNSLGLTSLDYLFSHENNFQVKIKDENKYFYIGDTAIPKISKNAVAINFFGPARTFETYSFAQIIDSKDFELDFDIDSFETYLDENIFKDKIVLIGATANELQDVFSTPFFNGVESMPGVEVHANFIEMVRMKNFIKKVSFIYEVIIIFLFILTSLWLFRTLSSHFSLIILIFFVIGYPFLAYKLFSLNNIMIPVAEILALVITSYIVGLVLQFLEVRKERKFIQTAFKHYLAPDVVEVLVKNPKALSYGGEQKEISVLFSDIRSFTTYTESHTTMETVTILREYLTAMTETVIRNKGILDKFVGDEIMALFGTPNTLRNHAYTACKVALEMRESLTELQNKWKEEGKDIFEIGLGVNSGFAVVGNLGSEQIFDYTAIGDTINLGARLEAINKNYNTKNKIIISEFTLDLIKNYADVTYLDEVIVKGKTKKVKIYHLNSLTSYEG